MNTVTLHAVNEHRFFFIPFPISLCARIRQGARVDIRWLKVCVGKYPVPRTYDDLAPFI